MLQPCLIYLGGGGRPFDQRGTKEKGPVPPIHPVLPKAVCLEVVHLPRHFRALKRWQADGADRVSSSL